MPGLPPGMLLFEGRPEPPPEVLPPPEAPPLGLLDGEDCPDGAPGAPGGDGTPGVPPGSPAGLPPGMLEGEGSPGRPPLGEPGLFVGPGVLGPGRGVTGAQPATTSGMSSIDSVLRTFEGDVRCIPAPKSMRASIASLEWWT